MSAATGGLRLAAAMGLLALLAGCTGVAAPASSAPATPAPTPVATASPDSPTTPPSPSTSPSPDAAGVTVTRDVAYESANDVLLPGILDVYAPPPGGPWPVVVMLHGTPSTQSKDDLAEHARRVAELGLVVFDATWGDAVGDVEMSDPYGYAVANDAQVACAIAFARANAARHGGDPSRVIVFGHSGGSNVGSVVVFGDTKPSAGCLGGAEIGPIHALVTWEGDFLLAPVFNEMLSAAPRAFDQMTPWAHLADRPDLPVYMLLSDHPGPAVEAPFTDVNLPHFLELRDKDGTLKRLIEKTGAIEDGIYSAADEQYILYEALREQGNPVTLDIMPGSSHTQLGDEGWKVFLSAFQKAASGG